MPDLRHPWLVRADLRKARVMKLPEIKKFNLSIGLTKRTLSNTFKKDNRTLNGGKYPKAERGD